MRISRPVHTAQIAAFCRDFSPLHTTLHRCGKPSRAAVAVAAFHGFFVHAEPVDNAPRESVRLYSPAAGSESADLSLRSTDETDLSAERTQAEAEARLPRPHVDACGPPDPEAPPRQGPQAPLGVSPVQRRNRLSRSRDFDAVYRHGRSVSTRFLTLYWFQRDEAVGDPRLGFAVPKAVGNAVVRNRIKRQLREIVRGRLERRRRRPTTTCSSCARACPRRPRRTASTGSRRASTRCSGRPPHERRVAIAPDPALPARSSRRSCRRTPASTTRAAPSTRCSRSASTGSCAACRWPRGGCCAATRGRTAESTTRDRRFSILIAARERDEVDPRLLPRLGRAAVGVVDRRADDPRPDRARAADGASRSTRCRRSRRTGRR